MTQDPFIGHVVGQRYRLERLLGRGGFGCVYEAVHVTLGKHFAIKFLHATQATSEEHVKRFEREAVITARLEHPNIVQVHDYGEDAALGHYLVMEFLPGETLLQRIRAVGHLDSLSALRLIRPVVEAFGYAHDKGVVHRDVKSANILLSSNQFARDVPKILDFGVARMLTASSDEGDLGRLTRSGIVMGSMSYISPEQAEAREVDGRSDLYSLGIILFELVTGQLPFKGDTPLKLIQQHLSAPPPRPSLATAGPPVHPQLEYIILKCLQKRPADRYATAASMLADVDDAVESISSGAPVPAAVTESTLELVKNAADPSVAQALGSRPGAGSATTEVATGAAQGTLRLGGHRGLGWRARVVALVVAGLAVVLTGTILLRPPSRFAPTGSAEATRPAVAVAPEVVVPVASSVEPNEVSVEVAPADVPPEEAMAAEATMSEEEEAAGEPLPLTVMVTSTPAGSTVWQVEPRLRLGVTPFTLTLSSKADERMLLITHAGCTNVQVKASDLVEVTPRLSCAVGKSLRSQSPPVTGEDKKKNDKWQW
jgi:serine/threonine-protein kinase